MDGNLIKILVVDDEINQNTALARLISAWGYEVKTASDGATALAVLKTFDADIVVTDLNMPESGRQGPARRASRAAILPYADRAHGFRQHRDGARNGAQAGSLLVYGEAGSAAALKMILERAVEKRLLEHHAGRLERELACRGAVGRNGRRFRGYA